MKFQIAIPITLGLLATSANAQNLLSNGSFETPGPGFVLFQGWQNFGNVFDDVSVEIAPQDGTTSAKMFGQFSGSQNDQVLLQTVLGITPGNLYTLSTYVQHITGDEVAPGNLVLLQLNFQDAGGGGLESVQVEAIVPGSTALDVWHQVEVEGIAPAGTDRILVALLHLQLDGAAGGASYWDNVELFEGEGPPTCNTPADFNGDGMLDFFDVQAFLQAFSAGCP